MEIYDLSLSLSPSSVVWPGDDPVEVKPTSTVEKDGVRVSRLRMGTHVGTHVDAPAHFLEDGKPLDRLALKRLVGKVIVVEVEESSQREIQNKDLDWDLADGYQRIIFKTKNTLANLVRQPKFEPGYVSISLELAEELVARGFVLVGIDYFGIEKKDNPGHPVHTKLLKNEVVVVEGLDLTSVPPGEYLLVCAPLKLAGADGAPARIFLLG